MTSPLLIQSVSYLLPLKLQVSSVQSLSHVRLFATSWTVALHASLSFISWSLLKLMPFNHLVLCHPLILLPSIFPSIRVFSNKLDPRISWPKYWSFSFSISTSNKYSGLISFRIDWFNLLVVQWTLKSLLQHHSLKAWILQCSAFSVVHLSHLYMTAGKTVALTIRTFVGKVISLIFNTLPKFVIAFVQGIFYFHDCSDVGAQENKVCHCFHCFPFYLTWSDWIRCHDLLNTEFQAAFSLSYFTFIKRLFSLFSLSAIKVASSAYLRLLMFLLSVLIPDCDSSSPAFCMMYSAYTLNKQGDKVFLLLTWAKP